MSPDQRARALRLIGEHQHGGYVPQKDLYAMFGLLRELAAEPVRQWLGPYTDAWTALNELRRAVAEVIGADPDVWPTHGNAPLAIAASVATRQMELEKRDAASAEPVRVPMTDEKFEEFIEQFRWYDGDVDRYDIQGFARELLRAHGIV